MTNIAHLQTTGIAKTQIVYFGPLDKRRERYNFLRKVRSEFRKVKIQGDVMVLRFIRREQVPLLEKINPPRLFAGFCTAEI